LSEEAPLPTLPARAPARSGLSRLASATAPLLVGGLLGFIGGYFAAGGGRPAAAVASSASVSPESAGRLESLKAELDRDPQNPKLLVAVANAYYDREDWDRAIETYEKAVRKGAKEAAVLSDLGAAYRNRGEFKRAIASFEKARAADPDHWQSLLNLVLVEAFDAKDPAAAQKAYDELKRRYPDIPNIGRLQEQISRLRAG
jgi:tetratricopeptide (TPR) repeat protein